ncbi:MAG: glycosyltransferase, partial [Bacteroidota bacterium]|nr:glycosyltransferase [Bacteroidota bacterium]
MSYLNQFIYYTTLILFVFLSLQSVYLLVFALAGRLVTLRKYKVAHRQGSFAIYIPAYKEDGVIVDTAKAALTLNYPAYRKHVIVIADSLQPATLLALRGLPIQVIEVSFEKSTKAKALNIALQKTAGEYDYALILDADNVCAKGFLYRMNDVLQSGFKVVQGQRVAKNTNTTFALLDAISEGINNHIFRKGHRALGLSAAIIGSGMAIDFSLFKTIMPEITAIGGFDKELQLNLLHNHIYFGYAPKAIVYDEKIMQQSHFENQRKRWLSAQFHYMRRYFFSGCFHLLKGNVNFFDNAIQTALLP